jgi:hypothetical protein
MVFFCRPQGNLGRDAEHADQLPGRVQGQDLAKDRNAGPVNCIHSFGSCNLISKRAATPLFFLVVDAIPTAGLAAPKDRDAAEFLNRVAIVPVPCVCVCMVWFLKRGSYRT